jgi:Lipocalin-like domain
MQSMLGTWKLIEGYALDKSGNRLPSPFGPQPMGVAEFGPERMIGVTGDARSSLPPEVNSRVLVAYSGPYSFDGSELVTKVDAASDPALIGTEQRRRIKVIDTVRLLISPTNEVLASQPGSLEFVWERVG